MCPDAVGRAIAPHIQQLEDDMFTMIKAAVAAATAATTLAVAGVAAG